MAWRDPGNKANALTQFHNSINSNNQSSSYTFLISDKHLLAKGLIITFHVVTMIVIMNKLRYVHEVNVYVLSRYPEYQNFHFHFHLQNVTHILIYKLTALISIMFCYIMNNKVARREPGINSKPTTPVVKLAVQKILIHNRRGLA